MRRKNLIQHVRITTQQLWLAALAVLSLIGVATWLVNVDVALQFLGHRTLGLRAVLSADLFDLLARAAVDHSTVSTLLPCLAFLIPTYCGWRLLRAPGNRLPAWTRPGIAPYPAEFAKFSIYAGLFGTLVGMWFGLPGVEASGSIESTQVVLRDLLAGFKTAVLSSVVGLVVPLFARGFAPLWRMAFRVPAPSAAALAEVVGATRGEFEQLTQATVATAGALGTLTNDIKQIQLEDSWRSAAEALVGFNRSTQRIADELQSQTHLLSEAIDLLQSLAASANDPWEVTMQRRSGGAHGASIPHRDNGKPMNNKSATNRI